MSNRQTLKDANYNVIGYIETESSGRQVLLDRQFIRLGYYDGKRNETLDAQFIRVGFGNILTSLLPR